MLQGKTVVLGVTGSIAAYKIASLASRLVKLHADVHVIMTLNATHFITPITFETLTGNKCLVDTFDRNFQFHVAHVSLAQRADVLLIAPASADVIGKIANGIADDMLTTTVLGLLSTVIALLGVAVLLTYSPQNGVILLVMAFLISPMGLPLAAIWLLGKVQSLKFAIQDRVYG